MGATARTVLALVSAVFVGFPAGWVLAMFCIPLFGWLEQVLHMELAGHSGPSNGVFYTAWILVIPALFFLFIRILAATERRTMNSRHFFNATLVLRVWLA